jgi:hypothetical protein
MHFSKQPKAVLQNMFMMKFNFSVATGSFFLLIYL